MPRLIDIKSPPLSNRLIQYKDDSPLVNIKNCVYCALIRLKLPPMLLPAPNRDSERATPYRQIVYFSNIIFLVCDKLSAESR